MYFIFYLCTFIYCYVFKTLLEKTFRIRFFYQASAKKDRALLARTLMASFRFTLNVTMPDGVTCILWFSLYLIADVGYGKIDLRISISPLCPDKN